MTGRHPGSFGVQPRTHIAVSDRDESCVQTTDERGYGGDGRAWFSRPGT
jgi:hypothetical protein